MTGLVVIAVLAGFVATLNRPWLEQWGSTAAERSGLLAGDDIVAAPSAVYTRSISIAAPPAEMLGPADLIVFPRLLFGLQQRAERTPPGMPGVPGGAPLPTARLPVQWWAALLWVAALVIGAVVGRVLGVGGWRRPRPHPGMTPPSQLVGPAPAALLAGSALVPLLGAALLEVFPTPAATRTSMTVASTRSDQDAGSLVHNRKEGTGS